MIYIVAYPKTLRTFETREDAMVESNKIGAFRAVKIYTLTEVAHLFPHGGGPPVDTRRAWYGRRA